MVYKKKKYKFGVVIDEFGKNKRYLNKLINRLEEDYDFLKQANRCQSKKRLATAKKGEIIAFGFSKKFDFQIVTADRWEDMVIDRRTPEVELHEDWKEVKELLQQCAEANYPEEVDLPYYYCKAVDTTITFFEEDDYRDNIYVYRAPVVKKKKTKKRKSNNKKMSVRNSKNRFHKN